MQDPVLGLRRSVGPQHVAGTGSFLGSPGLCSWRPWPCSPVGSATSCRLLRAILNTAVTDGLLQKSACQVKGAGQVRSPERPIASVAELAGAVDAAPERYQLAILLCAWCHLRRGEMLALQRRDVDPLHGTIRVERAWVTPQSGALMLGAPKTEAGNRVLHIPANVLPVLANHLDRYVDPGPEAWLFGTRGGNAISPRNFQRVWDRARQAVGRGDLHLHDLRHSGLTWAAATGATTKELMRRAGQKSPRAALIYQHATEERDRVIADALAGLAVPAPVATFEREQTGQ
jgi:integrase